MKSTPPSTRTAAESRAAVVAAVFSGCTLAHSVVAGNSVAYRVLTPDGWFQIAGRLPA